MKKTISFMVSLFLLLSVAPVYAYDEHTKTLTMNDIDKLYIHSDKHPSSQIAILQVKTSTTLFPVDGGGICDGGLWLNADTNAATYSMLLSAIATQKDIDVYYSNEAPPGGNVQYCALWRVGIK